MLGKDPFDEEFERNFNERFDKMHRQSWMVIVIIIVVIIICLVFGIWAGYNLVEWIKTK